MRCYFSTIEGEYSSVMILITGENLVYSEKFVYSDTGFDNKS